MNKQQLKALAAQDAAWTEIAEHEKQLETILIRGIETESDISTLIGCIHLVLGEILHRRAEMNEVEVAES